jgi:hypothetical protein
METLYRLSYRGIRTTSSPPGDASRKIHGPRLRAEIRVGFATAARLSLHPNVVSQVRELDQSPGPAGWLRVWLGIRRAGLSDLLGRFWGPAHIGPEAHVGST